MHSRKWKMISKFGELIGAKHMHHWIPVPWSRDQAFICKTWCSGFNARWGHGWHLDETYVQCFLVFYDCLNEIGPWCKLRNLNNLHSTLILTHCYQYLTNISHIPFYPLKWNIRINLMIKYWFRKLYGAQVQQIYRAFLSLQNFSS